MAVQVPDPDPVSGPTLLPALTPDWTHRFYSLVPIFSLWLFVLAIWIMLEGVGAVTTMWLPALEDPAASQLAFALGASQFALAVLVLFGMNDRYARPGVRSLIWIVVLGAVLAGTGFVAYGLAIGLPAVCMAALVARHRHFERIEKAYRKRERWGTSGSAIDLYAGMMLDEAVEARATRLWFRCMFADEAGDVNMHGAYVAGGKEHEIIPPNPGLSMPLLQSFLLLAGVEVDERNRTEVVERDVEVELSDQTVRLHLTFQPAMFCADCTIDIEYLSESNARTPVSYSPEALEA